MYRLGNQAVRLLREDDFGGEPGGILPSKFRLARTSSKPVTGDRRRKARLVGADKWENERFQRKNAGSGPSTPPPQSSYLDALDDVMQPMGSPSSPPLVGADKWENERRRGADTPSEPSTEHHYMDSVRRPLADRLRDIRANDRAAHGRGMHDKSFFGQVFQSFINDPRGEALFRQARRAVVPPRAAYSSSHNADKYIFRKYIANGLEGEGLDMGAQRLLGDILQGLHTVGRGTLRVNEFIDLMKKGHRRDTGARKETPTEGIRRIAGLLTEDIDDSWDYLREGIQPLFLIGSPKPFNMTEAEYDEYAEGHPQIDDEMADQEQEQMLERCPCCGRSEPTGEICDKCSDLADLLSCPNCGGSSSLCNCV